MHQLKVKRATTFRLILTLCFLLSTLSLLFVFNLPTVQENPHELEEKILVSTFRLLSASLQSINNDSAVVTQQFKNRTNSNSTLTSYQKEEQKKNRTIGNGILKKQLSSIRQNNFSNVSLHLEREPLKLNGNQSNKDTGNVF